MVHQPKRIWFFKEKCGWESGRSQGLIGLVVPCHDRWQGTPNSSWSMTEYMSADSSSCTPHGVCIPPSCMAEYSSFAPLCMVARPNKLVLKFFSKPDRIWNIFRIWTKNKKITSDDDSEFEFWSLQGPVESCKMGLRVSKSDRSSHKTF